MHHAFLRMSPQKELADKSKAESSEHWGDSISDTCNQAERVSSEITSLTEYGMRGKMGISVMGGLSVRSMVM